MFHKKWWSGIGIKTFLILLCVLLCGCSRMAGGVLARSHSDRHGKAEAAGKAWGSFPRITVVDTLPEVDETIPVEEVPLPSSEVINIMGQEEERQRIWKEDGSFFDETLSTYNVICHDHDVSFAMPGLDMPPSLDMPSFDMPSLGTPNPGTPDSGTSGQGCTVGQIIWKDSGVSVRYMGERELEILEELDEKNVEGDDCREFNEGMGKTRQLVAEGFLQDEFAKYLSKFPELSLEDKELTLELTYAGRTDRREDSTSWWELDYNLNMEREDGSSLTLATMDITRVFLVQGEENTWDDAHYRIWGYPHAMWELLEQPEEDQGETSLTVLPEGTFTDEASIYGYMEQFAAERQITWEYGRGSSFWYDYLTFEGEGGGYQYRVAVPVMDGEGGSWMIQAKIQKGAERPEACRYALSVFMQTFHANSDLYTVKSL